MDLTFISAKIDGQLWQQKVLNIFQNDPKCHLS